MPEGKVRAMTVIPSYDLIILPGVTYYFQKEYIERATEDPLEKGERVLFAMLKTDKSRTEAAPEDFYPIGAVGTVIGEADDDGSVGIRIDCRVDLEELVLTGDALEATACERPDYKDLPDEEHKKRLQALKDELLHFVQQFPWGMMARNYILRWSTMEDAAVALGSYMGNSNEEKYEMLAADYRSVRVQLIEEAVWKMISFMQVGQDAEQKQKENHEKLYREESLKKQIEILQQELDDLHPENITDVRRFEKKIAESGMNEEARAEADKVLNRMKQEGKNGHEYGMLYDYLDFITGLSWKKEAYVPIDLNEAERILEEDHYGLKKVKQRVLQQIAVMALNKRQAGSILLFVGAPGTGKTSIAQGIARAVGRKYARVSLGGIRDEAEIRGHRRTYVGAMPGRIMQGIRRTGVSNPIIVLDEVDKLSRSFDGDPSSALLEVLDPEQNSTFTDHYMNVPYDLSDVMFICTANSLDSIPEPLRNRMEIIQFQGYTESEKVQIAKRHLLPKSMKNMGIKASQLKISDKTLHALVSDYTMEAGVRGLKKQIDGLCRAAAVKLVRAEQKSITVSPKRIQELLDRKPIRHDRIKASAAPGIVTGLAWTQAGGDILFIETMKMKGSGKLIVTGQLGDVMKESAQIAVTLVKSMFPEEAAVLAESDLHIHVPEGAIPKDGPSAGITMTTALASLVTGRPVLPSYAMTGEVSLQGGVMPIGGLPEKLMAAVRAGVKTVFIPEENVEDLEDVADEVKEQLTILPVSRITEVLTAVGIMDGQMPSEN